MILDFIWRMDRLGAPNENGFQMKLVQLDMGESAVVSSVGGCGTFRRRLLELGVVPGTRVERTGQAPLGDPISYRVRGAVLCLRREEASTVVVEPI